MIPWSEEQRQNVLAFLQAVADGCKVMTFDNWGRFIGVENPKKEHHMDGEDPYIVIDVVKLQQETVNEEEYDWQAKD